MNDRRVFSRSTLAVALTLAFGLAPLAQAQNGITRTWTGSAGTGLWSNANNWSSPGTGALASTSSVLFNSNNGLTQTVDIGVTSTSGNIGNLFTLFDINFGTKAGAFTFNTTSPTPSILKVVDVITNASGQLQTFNVPVIATGSLPMTWDGGTGGMNFANAWIGAGLLQNTALTLKNNVAIAQATALLGDVDQTNATLNILSGSSASTGTLTLGRDFGSQGTVLLDGAKSKLSSSGALAVGLGSTGTITVQNGGTFTTGGSSVIGSILGGDGQVQVSGAGSSWASTAGVTIGDAGVGALLIDTGGKVSHASAVIGNQTGSYGTASVTDANSSWMLSGDLVVGNAGQGTLTVQNGALVSNRNATIGSVGDAGLSSVLVSDAGSRWINSGDLTVNSGSLSVAGGALVTVTNAHLGDYDGAAATVNLTGTGSALTVNGNLSLGNGSTASTVNIGPGATLTSAGQLVVGSAGVINLNGGTFNVGWTANAGQVNWISGTINTLGSAATGSGVGVLGHSTGLGSNMALNVNGDLVISPGDILSMDGGQIQTQTLHLQGELDVGSFSQISSSGTMDNAGFLQLAGGTINSTGQFHNSNLLSGYGVITGASRFWNSGLLQQSGGTLEIASQDNNLNTGNWEMLDGRGLILSGGNLGNMGVMSLNGDTVSGTAELINGNQGTLTGNGDIATAFQNDGRLAVQTGNFQIEQAFNSTGQILLGSNAASLSGGTINNSGRILGLGQVNNNIVNTGTVGASGGLLTLNGAVTNNGILSAGPGATLLVNQGLASNTGQIQLSGGTFDNNGAAMSNAVGAVISGYGTINGGLLTNAGKLLLSGGNSAIYANVLSQNASQIILSGNSNSTFYGNVDVQTGAELRVSTGSVATFFGNVYERTGSKFTGSGSKRFEGLLSIGASPGLGTDEGDVEFGDSSTYLAEIGGITACTLQCATDTAFKTSSYDKYIVAGNLSLNGTLQIVSWNGFVAQRGESFDLFDWGSLTGTFTDIDASGLKLAAGTKLDYSKLYVDGSISVTAVPEPGTLAMWLAGIAAMGGIARRRRS